ncbi:neutral zinc metallopeptidase [Actinoplanes sp. TFC3]|uniref:neutral zinc metallopeptidase n=1 Tax=Actinoplanes sp. TFC3 TaxID=1710355 RepID=UPI000833928C|nr:neutral zinc metallopeptidase [Actinoplanes sp. TFC3]
MPVPHRNRLVIPALLGAALIALGCVAAPQQGPAGQPARPQQQTRTSPAPLDPDVDGTDTVAEFQSDVGDARSIAEEYWKTEFDRSGLDFQPIAELIPYDEDGEVDCGGQGLGLNNAAYCSAGDFIAYDAQWAFGAFRQIGDAFIFYLLGHEYAHAIQRRLNLQAQFTIEQELQADCMAGAYIGDMEKAGRLRLEDGDLQELAAGLEAVGDDPGQPWFAEGAHGTAKQRTRAFSNGYSDSLKPCNLS